MNPRFREIHRAEIIKQMKRDVDDRWTVLDMTLSFSIFLVGAGIESFFISGAFGFITIAIAIAIFVVHRHIYQNLRNQQYAAEWLQSKDQINAIAFFCFAFFLARLRIDIGLVAYFMCGVFAAWRLRQSRNLNWRLFFFRAARQYYRVLKYYIPEKRAIHNSRSTVVADIEPNISDLSIENLQSSRKENEVMNNRQSYNVTFKYCTVELSAFSLMCISGLSAWCGGLMTTLLMIVASWFGMSDFIQATGIIFPLIVNPILAAVFGGIGAVLGYPFYRWICKKARGQRMTGIFHNPHD